MLAALRAVAQNQKLAGVAIEKYGSIPTAPDLQTGKVPEQLKQLEMAAIQPGGRQRNSPCDANESNVSPKGVGESIRPAEMGAMFETSCEENRQSNSPTQTKGRATPHIQQKRTTTDRAISQTE